MSECSLCGSAGTELLLARDGYRYSRCRGCEAASLDPLPTEAAASDLYGMGYFTGSVAGAYGDYGRDEAIHRVNARKRLRILARAGFTPPGLLVDVGSAFGFFLDEARALGWTVVGVDVSEAARSIANDRFDLETFPDLESLAVAVDEPAAMVTFFQSLEHLVHPGDALARARSLLGHAGGLVIETWDRSSPVARAFGKQWQQITPPSVVHLFNRHSLTAILEREGFSVRRIRRTTKYVSLAAVAHLLAEKYPAIGPAASAMVDGPGARIRVRYGLGDLVTVIADAA